MNSDILKRTSWHGGQLLAFSGLDGTADYDNGLTARTSFDSPGLNFMLPGYLEIRFPVSDNAENIITGDTFLISDGDTEIKAAFTDTHHLIISGPCSVNGESEHIQHLQENGRTLIGSASSFDPSLIDADICRTYTDRLEWLDNLRITDGLSGDALLTLTKFLSIMKTQVYTPQGRIKRMWSTPDRWPHRHMWLWDSVFHAIGWRHINPELARDLIDAMFDAQRDDGFIAHQVTPHRTSDITQPPVLALGVQLVNEKLKDHSWINEVYPKLCSYLEWDIKNRDSNGDGLLEWHIEGNPNCRSGESGMDNSPRFDTATQLDAVDFSSFLALECEILAGFAQELGLDSEAEKWNTKYKEVCESIQNILWSGKDGLYVDYDLDSDSPSPVLASSGFLPLICGACTQEQAQQLSAHLDNPETFGTPVPVPSIAVKDTDHYSKDMWRGPVWININWLIANGLDRYGMNETAEHLRKQTAGIIERGVRDFSVSFEFYDDRNEACPPELLRKGVCDPEKGPLHQVLHDYGWTATLYVDLVLDSTRSK